VELAFEGSRWFDIRRWKIADKVMAVTVMGATNPATGQAVVVETRKFNKDRDYVWPIPIQEIQGNNNIIQNPGY
jgi:starch-binding outer membrane protein, SusD/RagB family